MSRIRRKRKKLNNRAAYSKILKNRGVLNTTIMSTAVMRDPLLLVSDPSVTEKSILWTQGLKMWKIAADNYGDGRLYWVIALYNNKPTDAHWKVGDIVHIPFPVEYVVSYLRG